MGVFVIPAIIVAGCVLYFLPTFIATYRRVDCILTVILLNFFLSPTLIGWMIALNIVLTAPRGVRYPPGAFTFHGVAYPHAPYDPGDPHGPYTAPPAYTKANLDRMNYEAMFPPEERGYPTHPRRREPHF
jgi:hypothetical protein